MKTYHVGECHRAMKRMKEWILANNDTEPSWQKLNCSVALKSEKKKKKHAYSDM